MDVERIGVSKEVNQAMNAASANVLAEDGLMLRTCEHGVRHPVAHLFRGLLSDDDKFRHERGEKAGSHQRGEACCGCCNSWK